MENNNIEVVETNNTNNEAKALTVAEFINIYENDKTSNKAVAKNALIVKPYVNYELKMVLADNIVKSANVNSETGNIELNSPLKFIFFAYTIINTYTNIVLDMDNIFNEFNELNSRGLVDYLMKAVPEKELKEFSTVVDMVSDDLMANKYEIHAYVKELFEKFSSMAVEYLSPLSETLNAIAELANATEAQTDTQKE